MSSTSRLSAILNHFSNDLISNRRSLDQTMSNSVNGEASIANVGGIGSQLAEGSNPLHWNGWGYADTRFALIEPKDHHNDKNIAQQLISPPVSNTSSVTLLGSRYLFSGKLLPNLKPWMEAKAGINISNFTPGRTADKNEVPKAIINEGFLKSISGQYKRIDQSDSARLFHAHGHTCEEIYALRFGKFDRIPDLVVFPNCHEHVQNIVKAANEHDVVIIPYGGGTSVSHALICPTNERRMIVSLDMHCMNRIKWINKHSMMACIEAGAVGRDIERALNPHGVLIGHEPDSAEFSTLGGWVATRASGMRKNKYGNIEDILVKIKMVTAKGTIEKSFLGPRVSIGPDIHQFMLGSEGTIGVVTECVVRLRPLPAVTVYGSMIFPNFDLGVACLHEVAIARAAPVSIRLVDNTQFQFGMALKPPTEDWKKEIFDKIKKWYVLNRLHFKPDQMVAATLLFEGTQAEITAQENKLYAIAAKYGGIKAGEDNGIRGYFLTYMIAYLRDFGFNYQLIAESFETSVPWDSVSIVCSSVKQKIIEVCAAKGVKKEPLVSCRVTQLYDTGACIYFYFGFVWEGISDPVATFGEIEHEARLTILKYGGSLSHHHGIGKLRKWGVQEAIGPLGISMIKAVKKEIDPNNIFANDNLA